MPDKNKPSQKPRKHKESKHQHGSGKKFTHVETVPFKVRDKSGRVVHTEQRPVNRNGMDVIQKMLISRNYAGKRRAAMGLKSAAGRGPDSRKGKRR